MTLDESLARACEPIPGFLHGALALLPEGLLIGSVGLDSVFDGELLVRAATRCLALLGSSATPEAAGDPFVEHVFVGADRVVVIQQGRLNPRLALALVCDRETNLQLVISSTRSVWGPLETAVDLTAWGDE